MNQNIINFKFIETEFENKKIYLYPSLKITLTKFIDEIFRENDYEKELHLLQVHPHTNDCSEIILNHFKKLEDYKNNVFIKYKSQENKYDNLYNILLSLHINQNQLDVLTTFLYHILFPTGEIKFNITSHIQDCNENNQEEEHEEEINIQRNNFVQMMEH